MSDRSPVKILFDPCEMPVTPMTELSVNTTSRVPYNRLTISNQIDKYKINPFAKCLDWDQATVGSNLIFYACALNILESAFLAFNITVSMIKNPVFKMIQPIFN